MEDEEAVRHVVERTLSRRGYTVLMAVDGEEGLQVLQERGEEIDLVLLDLWMPKVSGTEVLPRMHPQQPPVVLFTGFAVPGDVGDRVAATLEKPVAAADLVECISRVMKENSAKR